MICWKRCITKDCALLKATHTHTHQLLMKRGGNLIRTLKISSLGKEMQLKAGVKYTL